MKKLAIALMLFFVVSFGAVAQKTIEDLNGYDWVTFTRDHQGGLVQGFYLGCSMITVMTYELAEPGMNSDQLKDLYSQLSERFLYPGSVGDMMQKLDDYYAPPANRKYLIFRTIPFLAGREWWNRQTGKVDVPTPPGPGS